MLLQRSSLAFLIYLASIATSSPLEIPQPFQGDTIEVQQVSVATNSTAFEPPHTLLSITEKCAVLSGGAISLSAAAAAATYITSLIKTQSNNHSCAIISGNVDGINYQYSASGKNCDTTSEQKTIDSAVEKAIKFMLDNQYNAACFELTHGGTWKGLLQLAGGQASIVNNKCQSVSYPISI